MNRDLLSQLPQHRNIRVIPNSLKGQEIRVRRARAQRDVLRVFTVLASVLLLILAVQRMESGTASASEPPLAMAGARPLPAKLSSLAISSLVTPKSEINWPAKLEAVEITLKEKQSVHLSAIPKLGSVYRHSFAGRSASGSLVTFTIDPALQRVTDGLIKRSSAPHVAIVALEPFTGRILALSERSKLVQNLVQHDGFPAASIFKVVTTAAGLEAASLNPDQKIYFHGGTYTLNQWNYLPNHKKDRRFLSFSEALGISCNPVFSRIALKYLEPYHLRNYARLFGFNQDLHADFALDASVASVPTNSYELGRTAAGFGAVTLSPIHAATIMAGIANGGFLPRPALVEQVIDRQGALLYQREPQMLRRILHTPAAADLLQMLVSTTTSGTSKREFYLRGRRRLAGIDVAAKTGTLRGTNPAGINHWFIAAAPLYKPRIALAVIVVDQRTPNLSAARIGRMVLEEYLL